MILSFEKYNYLINKILLIKLNLFKIIFEISIAEY